MNIDAGLKELRAITPFGNERETNDPWDLMGPVNANQRQRVMLALTGNKMPKAKCGVTAIAEAFRVGLGLSGQTGIIDIAEAIEAARQTRKP